MSEGSNKFFGDYGFDWITLRGWTCAGVHRARPARALPNTPLNFNDLRNRYRFVDGASGWNFNDHIRGSNDRAVRSGGGRECAEVSARRDGADGGGRGQDHRADRADGPSVRRSRCRSWAATSCSAAAAATRIEGREGDDLIDGDLWLNVQLRAADCNDGTVEARRRSHAIWSTTSSRIRSGSTRATSASFAPS